MGNKIRFRLNSKDVEIEAEPVRRLLDVLREDFSHKGPKEGCGKGECGACAVLVDGKLIDSCLYPVSYVEGKAVVTIEGISGTPAYRVLKEAFEEAGAVQCGFCTPGMIMASLALLKSNPHPGESEIREGLSGNLCRCTGYNMIISAVNMASEKGEGLW